MPPLIECAFGGIKCTTQGSVPSILCAAELPKPFITIKDSNPVENKDPVALTCEPQNQNTTYLWSIDIESLMDNTRLELSQDHGTLILFSVTRNDTGPYECEAQNPVSARRSDPLTPNVLLLLAYQWEARQYTQELFISNITVHDSGSYTCLVYNSGTFLIKITVKTITVSALRAPETARFRRKESKSDTWGQQCSERLWSRSPSHRGRDRLAADTLASPAAPAPRGPAPWQGLLLAVSLLTWNLPTTAQLTVESVPPNAVQGKDVLLLAHNLPESLLGYVWYKGDRVNFDSTIVSYVINTQAVTPGIAYSGRETIYPNGSLLFQNVTQKDTGYYTLQALHGSLLSTTAAVQLGVYVELPKPSIKTNDSNPVENKDPVVLTCEPQTQNTTYLWSINNQSLTNISRLELSQDHRTLTVFSVTRNDTGPYECEARNPVSARRSDPLTLNVLYGPDAPTISPSESYYRTGENLNLSCHAVSNPSAQYSWLISGRPQQSTQELFISNITVHDSGSYTCLVYNNGTQVNRTTVKTIKVFDEVTRPYIWVRNTTLTEHEDTVNLTCITNDSGISIQWFFNNQSLQLMERMKLSQDNRTLIIEPVRREDAGNYHCEVSNPVDVSKSDPIRLDVKYDATQQSSGLSAGAIAGIVIGVLAGVALIAALVYFLYIRKTGGTSDQRDLTEHKPSASNHSQGHSDNLHNKVDEIAYSSLNFSTQEARKATSATLSPKATETFYSEVKRSSATYPRYTADSFQASHSQP
ncbi:hypothetical protein MC885_012778 [Smutsia gigantea]|nr:hypothetical protein MC885_012778 [Smutsia gigantea]